jgi:hypothetical protein
MIRPPKLRDVVCFVNALEKNPFGSLVLLLILAMALIAWLLR